MAQRLFGIKTAKTIATYGILTVAAILALVSGVSADRFQQTLDDGSQVTVDNYSSWSDTYVGGTLVVAADRSTQCDEPFNMQCKGLFKTGDRIFVSNNYLAWFDYTQGDGVQNSFCNTYTRSGELAGWWTLNPSTQMFKYFCTGPDGYTNWAHNELIPGSDSPDQQKNWWDAGGAPIEHTINVESVEYPGTYYFMSSVYEQQVSESGFTRVLDGYNSGGNIYYETSGYLTSWPPYNCDVYDNNDSNGITDYIESYIIYICRPDDMICQWEFSPNATITANNIYVAAWLEYGQEETGYSWDPEPSWPNWPNLTGTVYGQDLYAQSSLPMTTVPASGTWSANSIVGPLVLSTPSAQHINDCISTYPNAPGNGDWIRVAQDSGLSTNYPGFQWINQGVSGSGSGTQSNPYQISWQFLDLWNENWDGTIGIAAVNESSNQTFQGGMWYEATFVLSTNF